MLPRRGLLAAALLAPAAARATTIAPDTVAEAVDVRVAPVLSGLANPWALAVLPDGALLVTERPGRLRRIVDGRLDPTLIAGVPPVLAQGQGGLLDIALSPGFGSDRTLFLSFAEGAGSANRTVIARARLDGAQLSDVAPIFRASPDKAGGAHFGSRLLFLPDGTLLASIGDGGNPPNRVEGRLSREHAQVLSSALGKLIRINADGSIPADNPWRGTAAALPALFSVGHRNIQGLAWDATRNAIWASEHGSSGGDELNRVTRGANHGWPSVTHSVEYGTGAAISPDRSRPGLADPVLVWQRTIAPSGLAVHSGRGAPAWRGMIFAGGLRSGDIRRIAIGPDGAVAAQHRIPIGARVRDVREAPDGSLLVLTDGSDGSLIRVTPA
jgi:glucose/arabinose dehydrogenase